MIGNEIDLLRDVSARLQTAGIEFMVTGSMAMSFYAQPRMTRDIDFVVALSASDGEKIVKLFEDDYYVERLSVDRAIARRSIFNLIHNQSASKVDFIVLKSDPYRQEEFARRRPIEIGAGKETESMTPGFRTWIVSREDLILSKLYWAKDSRSETQLRDVRNLLSGDCDMEYLRSRAKTLGVHDLLEEVVNPRE
ncbi:MAG TPA: nucleotidyl transferase AbiEii/AbiGii toxin family protein [Blastocatellia bacterium]|nr:nucleotidyl transferase AbiEii/AbiGii toxin family protein [Blastocatellia bacterium]